MLTCTLLGLFTLPMKISVSKFERRFQKLCENPPQQRLMNACQARWPRNQVAQKPYALLPRKISLAPWLILTRPMKDPTADGHRLHCERPASLPLQIGQLYSTYWKRDTFTAIHLSSLLLRETLALLCAELRCVRNRVQWRNLASEVWLIDSETKLREVLAGEDLVVFAILKLMFTIFVMRECVYLWRNLVLSWAGVDSDWRRAVCLSRLACAR